MRRAMSNHGRDALSGLSAAGFQTLQVVCHSCLHRGVLRCDPILADRTGDGFSRQFVCTACLSPDVELSPHLLEYEIE